MCDWLESRGSNQLFMVPYISAHIGHIEQMHHTLMAKAHTMHIYTKCPTNLWDEFYITAGHLQDKTMTHSLDGTTPWQKWYERQPDYSYMQEVSCRVLVLIQNKHNPKVYERSIDCILIGYDKDSKTYRCYYQETKKVYSSCHIQFLESCDGHSPLPPEASDVQGFANP